MHKVGRSPSVSLCGVTQQGSFVDRSDTVLLGPGKCAYILRQAIRLSHQVARVAQLRYGAVEGAVAA